MAKRAAAMLPLALAASWPNVAKAADWSLSASLTNDERRRGLSWSDGRPATSGRLLVEPAEDLSLSVTGTTLRGSARHDGASIGIDSAIVYRRSFGAIRVDTQISHHAFPGHGGANYVELGGGGGTTIGPVQLDLFGLYAPKQSAIGGDNLYLAAATSVALVGTPFTIGAQLGRSSGSSDDAVRSARLRPYGRYTDAALTVDYVHGPFTLRVALSDTWHGHRGTRLPSAADSGRRLSARVTVAF